MERKGKKVRWDKGREKEKKERAGGKEERNDAWGMIVWRENRIKY